MSNCEFCGKAEEDHAIIQPEEAGILRSLGYEVIVCDESKFDASPFVEAGYWWAWITKDWVTVDSFEVEEVCNNVEPEAQPRNILLEP